MYTKKPCIHIKDPYTQKRCLYTHKRSLYTHKTALDPTKKQKERMQRALLHAYMCLQVCRVGYQKIIGRLIFESHFPTEEPYNQWLFCGKRPATQGNICIFATLYYLRMPCTWRGRVGTQIYAFVHIQEYSLFLLYICICVYIKELQLFLLYVCI